MPFQAVAWAWNVPVTTAEERLALLWLSKEADHWNGLAYNFRLDDLADFVCVSVPQIIDLLAELESLGAIRGYWLKDDRRASATLEFPVMDWDTEEAPIANTAPLPPHIRREVAEKSACFACGSRVDVQADHIFPRAVGGLNCRENLQPLCGACNRRKRDKTGWFPLP
jgi:hypothetical protein